MPNPSTSSAKPTKWYSRLFSRSKNPSRDSGSKSTAGNSAVSIRKKDPSVKEFSPSLNLSSSSHPQPTPQEINQEFYHEALVRHNLNYLELIAESHFPASPSNTTPLQHPFDSVSCSQSMRRFSRKTRKDSAFSVDTSNKSVDSDSTRGSFASRPSSRAFSSRESTFSRNTSTTCSSAPLSAMTSISSYSTNLKPLPEQQPGLVSRGSTSTLQTSEKDRQEYFDAIQVMFLQLTNTTHNSKVVEYAQDITVTKSLLKHTTTPPTEVITIDKILMQLRILREAILSISPTEFHKQVLIYSILVSAVYGHYQTYTPSFLTLINDVLPEIYETVQLDNYYRDDAQFQRVCTIYVYHLLHYANDPVEAFNLLGQYFSPESLLYEFVGTWTDKDFFQWRRAFDAESDPALHRVMEFGEVTMAKEALRRVGQSYLRMDKKELEQTVGLQWQRIATDLGCEWQLENEVVMIRKKN